MSLREKFAWVSLAATAVFAAYWLNALHGYGAGPDSPPVIMLPVIAGAVVLEVIVAIALSIAASVTANHREVKAPADERERLIRAKSTYAPYLIYSAGVMGSTLWLALDGSIFIAVNMLIGLVVVAEAARYAVQIFFFRRGW